MLTTLRIRLPVWPFHSPLRTRLTEVTHLVEYRVHPRNHVFAVNEDRRASRSTKRHVQDCPLFSVVDLVPTEHGIDPRSEDPTPPQVE